jgi:predicted DNA-binding transcriptional regulator AlpA
VEDRLLPLPEVAGRLGISSATLNRWRKAGTAPPAIRVGARVYVRERELERWLADRPEDGAGAA